MDETHDRHGARPMSSWLVDSRLGMIARAVRAGDWAQLAYGMPRRFVSEQAMRAGGLPRIDAPVFFLSTGRCGTRFYTACLQSDRSLNVAHAPTPYMAEAGRVAFESVGGVALIQPQAVLRQALHELFLTGRLGRLRHCEQAGRRWVETNNWITFFAPVIAELLPQAQFVHLHRHPAEVVASGVARRWYAGNKLDSARPTPLPDDPAHAAWPGMDPLARTCWLWETTNRFILNFTATVAPERVLTISMNDIGADQLQSLAQFVGCRLSRRRVTCVLRRRKPLNAQQHHARLPFAHWESCNREVLIKICGHTAQQLGYSL